MKDYLKELYYMKTHLGVKEEKIINDFIKREVKEAREEGYKDGLSLRMGYCDDKLIKRIEGKVRKEVIEEISNRKTK